MLKGKTKDTDQEVKEVVMLNRDNLQRTTFTYPAGVHLGSFLGMLLLAAQEKLPVTGIDIEIGDMYIGDNGHAVVEYVEG